MRSQSGDMLLSRHHYRPVFVFAFFFPLSIMWCHYHNTTKKMKEEGGEGGGGGGGGGGGRNRNSLCKFSSGVIFTLSAA